MVDTALALTVEEVGHNCWLLEVYLLGIQVHLEYLQLKKFSTSMVGHCAALAAATGHLPAPLQHHSLWYRINTKF